MARRPRGGVRAGTPGAAYPNRTDLNTQHSLPVRTVPGQTYGAQVQQQNAQRLVPMRPPQSLGMPAGGAAPGMAATAPSPAGGQFQNPVQPLPPSPPGGLFRPSERPHEPVTAGAALGAGPGPEVLPQAGALTGGAMTSLLQRAAVSSGSSALRSLAMVAANQGK
jgi:hypothetical protein